MNKKDFYHKLQAIALDMATVERDVKKLKADCDNLFNYFIAEERTKVRNDETHG